MKSYPNGVTVVNCDKAPVVNTDIYKREILHLNVNQTGKTVLGIFMNPSKADHQQADDTILGIHNYFAESRHLELIKDIIITNIYPFYKTRSPEYHLLIDDLIKSVGEQVYYFLLKTNLQTVKNQIKNADEVFIGWGNPPKDTDITLHRAITSDILKEINDQNKPVYSFVFHDKDNRLTKYGNPIHPLSRSRIVGHESVITKMYYAVKSDSDFNLD